MKTRTNWLGLGVPMALLVSCGLLVACSDDPQRDISSSGAPQLLLVDPGGAEGSENRAPEINSIRFEPAEAMPGRTLRARVIATDPDHDPVQLGYTWRVNGRRAMSSGSAFELPSSLRSGDRIEVSVIASDGQANSEPTLHMVRIENRQPSIREVHVHVRGNDGDKLGHWMADPIAEDPDGDQISFRYSWLVNGNEIDVETTELARAPRKRGDEIRVRVWATDGQSESAPFTSAPFTVQNSAPNIDSRPPAMDPSGRFNYAVQASDRDGDRRLRYSLNQGPSGMTIDALTGELRWLATVQNLGEHIVEIAVNDGHGGVTTQTFYVAVGTTGPASAR